MDKICGNCYCYTALRFDAEFGRCRRFNRQVQLRTPCLKEETVVCNCGIEECMDRGKKEFKIGDDGE